MKVKSIIFFIVIALIVLMGTTNVQAASTSISATSTSVEEGTAVNINVSFTAAAWNLTVSGDKISGASYASQTSDLSEVTTTKSFAVDTSTAGTYTVRLSGDITDENGNTIDVDKTVTITVKAQEVPEPTPSEPETPVTPSEPENPTTPTQPEKPSEPQTPTVTEPNFTSTKQTVYAKSGTGSVNLRASWSTASAATNVKNGTELTLTGTSTETINGYVWSRVSYQGQTKYVASGLITTTKPEEQKTEDQTKPETPAEEPKSSNVNLKELKVNVEGLTPEFKKEVKEYTLNVKSDVEKIEVTAVPEDEKSKVSISGNEELKTGENLVLITVNAEDGTTTIYEIKVTKAAAEGLKLSKLEIADYVLSPKFNPDVFEYKLNVIAVDKLDITAEANDEKATIEIVGNTELQDGENLVTIMVKSEDGEKTTTYQITVNKREALIATKTSNDNNNLNKIILAVAALIVIIILALVLTLFKKKKNNNLGPENYYNGSYDDKEDDYENYDNYNENYNNYGKEEYGEEITYDDDNTDFNNNDEDDFGGKRGKHF